jgi:PKD repeat protein
MASFSNRGSCVDINAPGVNITSAWMGSTTATNTISGTSMATPHVAGTIALYLQVNPTHTAAQVDAALKANASTTAVPSGTTNKFLYSGFITVSAPTAVPVAALATPTCPTLTCSFDASGSTNSPTSYTWDFGDATAQVTTTTATTSHAYSAPKTGGYTVSVWAANAIGTSASPATATASPTPPPPPPPAPSAPSALALTVVSATQINLRWTDGSTNEDGFKIERCSGASCTAFAQITTVGANVVTYSNTALTASTSYSYRVRAYNAGGNSPYSNTASATTTTSSCVNGNGQC